MENLTIDRPKGQDGTREADTGPCVDLSGRGAGSDSPENPEIPPLVYGTYGHNPLKQGPPRPPLDESKILENTGVLKVWADGWTIENYPGPDQSKPANLVDVTRGEIKGFSSHAAKRLRHFLCSNWIPGKDPFAVTLTTRKRLSPEEWQSAMKRCRTYMLRKYPDWGLVWRVELQKRKTPHLHCVLWAAPAPGNVIYRAIRDLWLDAIREADDPKSIKHAVRVVDLAAGADGWTIYTTLHSGKHKEEQLGWKGKQWGIWGAANFAPRPTEFPEQHLTEFERLWFLRILRRHRRAQLRPLVVSGKVKSTAWRVNHRAAIQRCQPAKVIHATLQAVVGMREAQTKGNRPMLSPTPSENDHRPASPPPQATPPGCS